VAYIDKLVAQVDEPELRQQLLRAVDAIRKGRKFGLVFEEHVPETVMVPSFGVQIGTKVARRNNPEDPDGQQHFIVTSLKGDKLTIAPLGSNPSQRVLPLADGYEQVVGLNDIFVVQYFNEPVYPILTPVGSVRNGGDKPSHVVLNGENFHALQLLLYAYQGKVDCIYIDPPYNTGDKAGTWKYNNRFVFDADASRHDKWLSFMEKRLKLAKQLLSKDGVLVVTIDEHEVHHLGVLMEQLFRGAYLQMVTIVTNPKGVTQSRFSRVEEYAIFCFLGSAEVRSIGDDLLTLGANDLEKAEDSEGEESRPRWKGLLRSGDEARRQDRKDMFYPVLIDENRGAVVGVGEVLEFPKPPNFKKKIDGFTPVWPVRRDGTLGRWGVGPTTLQRLVDMGYVKVGSHDPHRNTWAISYLSLEPQEQIQAGVLVVKEFDENKNAVDVVYADSDSAGRRIKSVWHRSRHDAGAGGTDVIRNLLGGRFFSFPKSLYAVQDTLTALVGDKPDALILDFFAGSGTTLHATLLMNAHDDGNRRCILVTNNELSAESESRLRSEGKSPGDPEWESEGVFESVTLPRIRAAVSGFRPDGTEVGGSYLNGRAFSEGFVENVDAFRLDYAHRTDIALRRAFRAVLPVLWMAAGCVGDPSDIKVGPHMVINKNSPMAILLSEDHIADFLTKVVERSDITHVWLVTDSPQAFARMRSLIPGRAKIGMLYRDFLANFEMSLRLTK
jgi:adenine-specific DNA-methyltransferase